MKWRNSTSGFTTLWSIIFRVKITVWDDGFTFGVTGKIHYVDPITHQLRIEVKPGEFDRINFEDVVGVGVIDY
ncbi:YolD-like family protein [Neobacillus pocheonensis]|uniref:YolD-like family protein n=1 Tax=Neobacillus pocheonensis TaxID=363869 RepID=A0ABT0W560_9BACI|nr:YolD-like family protein [Neobacillus pocheonensis]